MRDVMTMGPHLDGVVRAYVRPPTMSVAEFIRGGGVLDHEAQNVVTNTYWTDLFNTMSAQPSPTSLAIICLSVGTGTGLTPARTDLAMGTEWRRYSLISATVSGTDPPNTVMSFFLPSTDGAVGITEVGLFYGSATLTAGTGKMASHASFGYGKSATNDLRLDYTVSRSTAS